MSIWPEDFSRIPRSDPWVASPIETLARKYDTVENHGWYRNLEPTLDDLQSCVKDGDLIIDYSVGTGILVDRLLKRLPRLQAGCILVDASPKFLRLALDKLGDDDRTAFRWIQYVKSERRLQTLDEVLPDSIRTRGVAAICSTNAIHLYYNLPETLRSWARFLRPGGSTLVQSGNINNPNAASDWWIIDSTVEHLQEIAEEMVRSDETYAEFRAVLDDAERMAAYGGLRKKYFLPVRPLDYYLDQLRGAGLEIERVYERPIEARVDEWCDFLSAYHDGVLGWAGGTEKISGVPPSDETIELRLQLLRESLSQLFGGADTFDACWTYITCRIPAP